MELSIDEIVEHMTPVGRYEFDLACLRAQLSRKEQEVLELRAAQNEASVGVVA